MATVSNDPIIEAAAGDKTTYGLHHERVVDASDEIDPRAVGGHVRDLPKGYYKSWSFIGTFVAAAIGSQASYATYGLPTSILTVINQDIGPNSNFVWVNLVWTLSCAVIFAIGGRLTDLFGRRWWFIIGNALGTIGSIVAATAKTIPTLVGASVLIGLAAGVQQTWPMAIDELVPNGKRGYVNAAFWGTALPFSVFGPVIARTLGANSPGGWRGCYYIAIALCATATVLFYLFYHPPTFELLHVGKKKTLRSIFSMIDLGGLLLFTAGMILFLLGISWGGQQYPWKSGQVIGCLVAGFLLLVAFALFEAFYEQQYPLIPIRLFRNVPYIGYILAGAFITLNYYNLCILWPMQIQVIYSSNQVEIGWLACTTGGGALLGDLVAGTLVKPLKHQRIVLICFACIGVTFTAALSAATPDTRSLAIACVILSGFSVGAVEAYVYTLCPLTCSPEEIGLANGVMLSARTAIPTISVAIYLSVLTNKLAVNIPKYVTPAAIGAGLPADDVPLLLKGLTTGVMGSVPGLTPHILDVATIALKEAYTKTFRVLYISTIAWGAVGVFFAWLTKDMDDELNGFVGRKLQGK